MHVQNSDTSQVTRTSLRKTLLQAAGLALVLVPLGTVAVQTAPISCGFGGNFGYGGGEGGSCQAISNNDGTQTNRFNWGAYFVEITLNNVVGSFDLTIDDVPVSQGDFDERSSGVGGIEIDGRAKNNGFSSDCIPMVSGGGSTCREFVVDAPNGGDGGVFWSTYLLKIAWLFDTDRQYPGIVDGNLMAGILHDVDDDGFWDFDMCVTAGYDDCEYVADGIDPFISSGDTDFSSFIVHAPAAPEPALLALMASGLGGLLYRRRRSRS
jgi:hypothetical protein